jgi:hypothetical protein
MSIHVALHHRTTCSYDQPVSPGPQIVRLEPSVHTGGPAAEPRRIDNPEHPLTPDPGRA